MNHGKTLPGETGVDEKYLEAYKANYAAHEGGITTKQCIAYYDSVSEDYEKNLSPDHYNGPRYAADAVFKYFKHQAEAKIVDVAAGTGYLGEELKDRGFLNIDALEPSTGMLKHAESKNIYKRLVCQFLEENGTGIENDEYDCLALSGGMGEGHIPCRALTEMCRIVKPGGLVIIVMREEYLSYVEEYVDRLEPFMKELERLEKWELVERTVVPKYSFGKNGVIFVYKVRENGLKVYKSSIL